MYCRFLRRPQAADPQATDPLELELEVVMSHLTQAGARNETQVFCQSRVLVWLLPERGAHVASAREVCGRVASKPSL